MKLTNQPRMPGMTRVSFSSTSYEALRRKYKDFVDPAKVPSKVVSLKYMSPEKRAEMERLYGSPQESK